MAEGATPGACVIVGAGPGISAAVAARFAAEGHPVGLVGRSGDRLAELAAGIDGRVAFQVGDAANAASLTAALDALRTELGPPAVALYNAYAQAGGAPSQLDAATLGETLAANVGGAATVTRALAGDMVAAGRGTLLFTGGGLALHPSAAVAALSVGKAALRAYVAVLHEELAAKGVLAATVTVNGYVQPGTHFDPGRIAEVLWELHRDGPGRPFEVQYS